jgi:hypothetical protein
MYDYELDTREGRLYAFVFYDMDVLLDFDNAIEWIRGKHPTIHSVIAVPAGMKKRKQTQGRLFDG